MVATTSTSGAWAVAAIIQLRNHWPTGVWGGLGILAYPAVLPSGGRNVRWACEPSAVDFSDVVTIHSSGARKSRASTARKIARHGTREPVRGSGVDAVSAGASTVVVLIASPPWGCAP